MTLLFKFLLCSCFIVIVYGKSVAEFRLWFMNLGVECSKEHHVTPDEMLMLHQHQIPDSENAKCLLACVHRKAGWFTPEGTFDVDSAKKLIEKEYLNEPHKIEGSKKLFEECQKVNDEAVSDGSKGCDRAALLTKCLTDNANKHGFDVMC